VKARERRNKEGTHQYLAFAGVHARLAITRVFKQLDLTCYTSVAMRTVALEASRFVEANSAVLARLTAAVVPRITLTQPTLDARWTDTDEVGADAS